jgi:hypothetical protein
VTLVSLAAYAAMHDASKQAATKWKSRGLLTIVDGKVDVERSDRAMRGAAAGRFKPSTAVDDRRDPVDAVDVNLVDEELDDASVVEFVEALREGRFATEARADQIKANALALKHLVAAQLAAGSVCDIALAESVIFEDRRKARDAWMNWPSRIGPLLAADLDVDDAGKVVEALNGYVHQLLSELGEPDVSFTASGA